MTKQDRAKMTKRLHKLIPWLASGHPDDQDQIVDAIAWEVDRAVRAERKAWKDAEELRLARLRRIDEQLVDGFRKAGNQKTGAGT